jgi:Xaa-Pro aminopeptidase
VALAAACAAGFPAGGGDEPPPLLARRERAALRNAWLKERFETILPAVMRREGIDMWVVVCREHAEDPVYWSLVPEPSMFAWRLTMLVFFDRGGAAGVERLSVNRWGGGDLHKDFPAFYAPAWAPESLDPWDRLARIVRERDSKRIAVNASDTFAFADGLSAANRDRLVRALGPGLASRLVSAERLAVGWLEARSAGELAFYPGLVALTRRLVREVFSSANITPGRTTIDDLEWRVLDRLDELNLGTWFPPMFYILRDGPGGTGGPDGRVIKPGDLLRCDIGISYLGLVSDVQEVAYVPREGETEAPRGLRDALALGNRLQDILVGELRAGRTGNEILAAALAKARAAGLVPRIYSHPIGYHGHGAGTRIGLPDMQDGVPGMGEYPLFPDTCFAIELGVAAKIPEWGGREIQLALEEDAAFTAGRVVWLDGRQTEIILVK